MTHEQRLDRIERIALLFVKAGIRQRRNMRRLDEKVTVLVDMQIKNEERFARSEVDFARTKAANEERFARNEADVAQLSKQTEEKFVALAESQAQTDLKFRELINILRNGRNRKLLEQE